MHSAGGDTPSRVPGFPIRKSPDHSLVADSPRHIAGSHVLHRLLMPRHPPYALKNLNTQNDQNKSQRQNPEHETPPETSDEASHRGLIRDARVHCAVLKKQPGQPEPHHRNGDAVTGPAVRGHRANARFLRTQQRVQSASRPELAVPTPRVTSRRYLPSRTASRLNNQCSTSMSSHPTNIRRR